MKTWAPRGHMSRSWGGKSRPRQHRRQQPWRFDIAAVAAAAGAGPRSAAPGAGPDPAGARAGPSHDRSTLSRGRALPRGFGDGNRGRRRQHDPRLGRDHRRRFALDVPGRRGPLFGFWLLFFDLPRNRRRRGRRRFDLGNIEHPKRALRVRQVDCPGDVEEDERKPDVDRDHGRDRPALVAVIEVGPIHCSGSTRRASGRLLWPVAEAILSIANARSDAGSGSLRAVTTIAASGSGGGSDWIMKPLVLLLQRRQNVCDYSKIDNKIVRADDQQFDSLGEPACAMSPSYSRPLFSL